MKGSRNDLKCCSAQAAAAAAVNVYDSSGPLHLERGGIFMDNLMIDDSRPPVCP